MPETIYTVTHPKWDYSVVTPDTEYAQSWSVEGAIVTAETR
jgi:hypothetical protein